MIWPRYIGGIAKNLNSYNQHPCGLQAIMRCPFQKNLIALFYVTMLAACVGSGDTTPTVTDVQGKGLNYGTRATFDFYGTYLDKGLSANVQNCVAPTPTFISPVHQTLTCTVSKVGDLTVVVQDGGGKAIYSKAFTVPPPRAAIVTSLGNMVVELDPVAAPVSVGNFLQYVQSGFYSDILFHRVIAGYVIQAGAFGPGLTIKPGALPPIAIESNNGLSNKRGTIGMARNDDPNSAASQFYFNLADNLFLDYKSVTEPGYAVFGRVVEGMEVMDAIGAVTTATQQGIPDVPVIEVVIKLVLRTQ